MKKQLTLLLLLCIQFASAQDQQIFLSKPDGVYSRQASGCVLNFVGPAVPDLVDIALTPNGKLYGVTYYPNPKLYEINTANGVATLLTTLTLGSKALVALDDTKLLFVTSQQLYSLTLDTYEVSLLGTIGYESAGDLAFMDGDLFFGAMSNLIKIKLNETNTAIETVTQVNTAPTPSFLALMVLAHPYYDTNILMGFDDSYSYEICVIDGTYEIRCYVDNAYGATSTDLPTQVPKPDVCPTQLGLSEFDQSPPLSLFPNPANANSVLEIKLPQMSNGPVGLKIYNLQGIVLYDRKFIPDNTFEIDLGDLDIASGVYMVEYRDSGIKNTSRLVIR